ncbi:unnamed protein product [Ectocarpus sp. 6 AP-2014]
MNSPVRHSTRGDGVGRGNRSLSPTSREMVSSFGKRRDRSAGSPGNGARDGRLQLLWQQPGKAASLCLSGRIRLTGSHGSTRLWLLVLLAMSVGFMVVQQFSHGCVASKDGANTFVSTSLGGEEPGEKVLTASEVAEVVVRQKTAGENPFVSEGVYFHLEECPYEISSLQAESALAGGVGRGNTVELLDHGGGETLTLTLTLSLTQSGRCGNHFMTVSSYLAMGFCCRSRLLTLPATDDKLPDELDNFTSERRWFDFSNVTVPWPEYQEMGDDEEVCRPETKDGGRKAFGYEDVHPKLLECMNRVYLRGCEKAYLGKLVDVGSFCPKQEPGKRKGAGSLVAHIRSGDIFNPDGEGHRRQGFGQPPLQYYLRVLAAKDWDNVTFLTAAWEDRALNPTFLTLEMMADAGVLGENVHIFNNRTLLTDMKEMLCADALATSRSSMSFLTFAHSRATTFFVPTPCGNGGFRRMKDAPVKATFDNTTLLLLEKRESEVFGVDWHQNRSDYSVYKNWLDSPHQLLEMTTYKGIKGLKKCTVYPPAPPQSTDPPSGSRVGPVVGN